MYYLEVVGTSRNLLGGPRFLLVFSQTFVHSSSVLVKKPLKLGGTVEQKEFFLSHLVKRHYRQ